MGFRKQEEQRIPASLTYSAWSTTLIQAVERQRGEWCVNIPNGVIRDRLANRVDFPTKISMEGFVVHTEEEAEHWVKFLGPLIDQVTKHSVRTAKIASDFV